MSIAELPIAIDHDALAAFCRARGIRRLSLFGSITRDDFDPARSDIDVLVDYDPERLKGLGWDIIDHQDALARLLGRPVDYCTRLHPAVMERVSDQLIPIYERA